MYAFLSSNLRTGICNFLGMLLSVKAPYFSNDGKNIVRSFFEYTNHCKKCFLPFTFDLFAAIFYLILSHFFLPIPLKKMAGVAMTQIHTSGSILEEREREKKRKKNSFLSLPRHDQPTWELDLKAIRVYLMIIHSLPLVSH